MTSPIWPALRTNLVEPGRLLHTITVEGELLAGSAAGARADLPVPGCPGLTVGSTVTHTGSVYRRTLDWIRGGEPPDTWERRPEEGEDPIEFLRRARVALAAELAAHGPEEPCATWWPLDRTYGFWRRRMAHETTVHRVDVQAATGVDVDPVPADLAADGIDEALLLWFGHRLTELGMTGTTQGAIGVQVGRLSWLAVLGRPRALARRVPAADALAADALVTGDPMTVYLWLWGRVPDRAVTITGDIDASAQLWALLRTATQ
ncbi:MAG TPA: maleylpyruvate isomerase N-terminal domain-containing protein [Pseudonocardiaceae bacterium]